LFVLVLGALSSGCAPVRPILVSRALGPEPFAIAGSSTNGTLVAYTAIDGFDTLDAEHEKHTSFEVFSESGKLLKSIRNQEGSFYQEPTPVMLPPGHYRISALAANLGLVSIPVVIEARKTTTVYLDGITALEARGRDLSHLVRLPNGKPIGWEAEAVSLP